MQLRTEHEPYHGSIVYQNYIHRCHATPAAYGTDVIRILNNIFHDSIVKYNCSLRKVAVIKQIWPFDYTMQPSEQEIKESLTFSMTRLTNN